MCRGTDRATGGAELAGRASPSLSGGALIEGRAAAPDELEGEDIEVRDRPHREGPRAAWDSRPGATWRMLAGLAIGFAILAASLYAAVEYRETRAHHGAVSSSLSRHIADQLSPPWPDAPTSGSAIEAVELRMRRTERAPDSRLGSPARNMKVVRGRPPQRVVRPAEPAEP